MVVSQVDMNGKPSAACSYRTRVPTLGISLVLRETGHGWELLEDSMFEKERETPYLGAYLLAVSFKKGGVVFGEYCERCLFKEYAEAVVA